MWPLNILVALATASYEYYCRDVRKYNGISAKLELGIFISDCAAKHGQLIMRVRPVVANLR
jgi:hypothetical protein